ncbi:MAG: hypothetical protein AMJ45_04550 [Syntrophobacter sp. DG_60]|nr:MAG: hypothetical protein AMJ45_04550 [Syntrophobacter sp. DG_60]
MKGNVYLAWSSNEKILEKAEYGGVVTSLLKFALENKEVDAVLAVKKRNGDRYDGILSLITDPNEVLECAGTLHFSSVNIARNLKEYLDGAKDTKIAVTCKPCDARAIIELSKRGQINIENLFLIGLNCTGTILPQVAKKMIKEEFLIDPYEVIKEDIDNGKFIIFLKNGDKKEKSLDELERKGYGRRENCRRCEVNIPRMADIACGKWGVKQKKATFIEICSERGDQFIKRAIDAKAIIIEKASEESVKDRERKDKEATQLAHNWGEEVLNEMNQMSYEQRLSYWFKNFDRCIKCFGCKDACPICYCKECYLESWRGFVKAGEVPPDKMFPLVRLSHVADSCVNCGQCQDSCPMEIPFLKLYYMLQQELIPIFGYRPGFDVNEPPPLTLITEEEFKIQDVNFIKI